MPEPLNVIPHIPWPAPQSWLYMGLILINISSDWIGQPATSPRHTKALKNKTKQKYYYLCLSAGHTWPHTAAYTVGLMQTISKIQSIWWLQFSLRGFICRSIGLLQWTVTRDGAGCHLAFHNLSRNHPATVCYNFID